MLLERSGRSFGEAIAHLVGMQAQNPQDPYYALWSRVDGFDPEQLSGMIERREAVRGPLLRATLHLATTSDFLALRAQLQDTMAAVLGSTQFSRDTRDLDRDALLEAGRSHIEQRPMTRAELGRLLEEAWPQVPGNSLAMVVTYLLPLIQTTPRGLWRRSGQATWTTIKSWTGLDLPSASSVEATVRRYLADGVILDEETPAPPRFLPEYDNVLLGHQDRSRFLLPGVVPQGWVGNLLVDGFFSGSWKVVRSRDVGRLEVSMLRAVSPGDLAAVEEEAERLLLFAHPDAEHRELSVQGPD